MSYIRKTIKVSAVFKGEDGSHGYKTGIEYRLRINAFGDGAIIIVALQDVENNARAVPYSNIVTFLNNWEKVTEIKD